MSFTNGFLEPPLHLLLQCLSLSGVFHCMFLVSPRPASEGMVLPVYPQRYPHPMMPVKFKNLFMLKVQGLVVIVTSNCGWGWGYI